MRRDMLAWVHQALASERELFLSLFGEEPGGEGGVPAERSSDMPSITSLLDRVFESICKPLKVPSANFWILVYLPLGPIQFIQPGGHI